jgi:hypothetical protein
LRPFRQRTGRYLKGCQTAAGVNLRLNLDCLTNCQFNQQLRLVIKLKDEAVYDNLLLAYFF